MNWKELIRQANEKRTAIKALLGGDSPDLEAIKALDAEAEALEQRAALMKKNEEALKTHAAPQMPADLPTGDDPPTGEPDPDAAVKTLYTLRYGTIDAEVKAVLTDLHGAHFERKRIEQWAAWNRYLRGGDTRLKSGDGALLMEVILTPEFALEAIKSGREIMAIKTVMVEAVDTLGGYVVPVDWQARLLQRLRGLTAMRGRAFRMETSRDAVEMPTLTGGDAQYTSAVRVTWVDETPTAATAATNLTFGSERIPVHTVMAETFLSRNLVEDSALDLPGLLSEKFAEAAAIDEDNQFLTGDANGRPQGLLPSSANDLSITEANSGNASALTWDGLIDLIYAPASQYRAGSIFIGEKATYKAIAKLKDGNGQYLWRSRFGNNVEEGGSPTRLMGYETVEQEAMPTIASDAFVLLFGDPRGYTIVDRVGMTVERYLDSSTARINQVVYVMRRRLGGHPTEVYRWAVQKVSA